MILFQKFIAIEMHFDLNISSENMRHVLRRYSARELSRHHFIRLSAMFSDRITSSVLFE